LFKEDKILRFRWVFNNRWFGSSVMDNVNYMFFNSGFEGSSNLSYVRFPTGVRNLVNSWAQHRVRFIFYYSRKLFKGFVGIEHNFDPKSLHAIWLIVEAYILAYLFLLSSCWVLLGSQSLYDPSFYVITNFSLLVPYNIFFLWLHWECIHCSGFYLHFSLIFMNLLSLSHIL